MNCVWLIAFNPDLAYAVLAVNKNHDVEASLTSLMGFFILEYVEAI